MSESYTHISGVRRRSRSTFHHKARREDSPGASRSRRSREYQERGGDYEDPEDQPRSRRLREEREDFRSWQRSDPRRALPYYGPEEEEDPGFRLPFDPWRLLGAAKRNWAWVFTGAALLALLGVLCGMILVDYKVSVPLLRKQTPNAFQAEGALQFGPRDYSDQTLFAFMRSGEVYQRVAQRAATNAFLAPLDLTAGDLAGKVAVNPSPNPDVIFLSVAAFGDLPRMVTLANIYAEEVVDYTREMQRREALSLTEYLRGKLAEADQAVERASLELRTNFSSSGYVDFGTETDADLKRLQTLRQELIEKQIERQTLESRIASRQEHMKEAGTNTRLAQAREEYRVMRTQMTEKHFAVVQKRAEIETLEKMQANGELGVELPATGTGPNDAMTRMIDLQSELPALTTEIGILSNEVARIETRLKSSTEAGVHYALKQGELKSLQATRTLLDAKTRQAELLADNAMGYFTVMAPATMNSINFGKRWLKVALLGFAAGLVGMVASLGLVLLTEAMDTTLKTPEDVTRVTQLPVLAALGDLRKMTPEQQVKWAFRTLTLLRGKLSTNPDQAMVCGIISSGPGEGRSTWVNLLVSAASQRGLRVLTVDTRPAGEGPTTNAPEPGPSDSSEPKSEAPPASSPQPEYAQEAVSPEDQTMEGTEAVDRNGHANPEEKTVEQNVFLAPERVEEQLEQVNDESIVHIPLPGWVWSLERRKQWHNALDYWKKIDNLVIFVELPPASQSEAVLLAEHVPQVIWLTGSGMADAAETATHLETLRHAGCNLVGAVLNQAPPPMVNARIARWFTKMTAAFILGTGLFQPALAQDQSPSRLVDQDAVRAQQLTFSGTARQKRAAWQERLTFGPGDTMDISIFGRPALTRTNIFVGPDGRISYLQVQGLTAADLTVQELRERLDEALAEYYTGARSIVIPAAFSSKKYYMLGKVAAKGVYQMDRPLSIIEAVARAKGLETGMYQRTSVELADLSHSFIVRNGKKLPVNLEQLFLQGDLSQNVMLEPGDYVFFASSAANDIYVLGEVMTPGPIGFVPNATIVSAVTDRGGYTDRAYRGKVLVVRGSLESPETFVVNTRAILDGAEPDFPLQPKDIVFVRDRPWIKVEELLDEAVQSFIQGAITTWAGVNVGPIIKKEILPSTR